jgi:Domain of unknown function (DUF4062)
MTTDPPLDAARRSTGALPVPAQIRTPDQRVRVFVSSTLDELAPERAAAREAITQLRLTPVLFESGARPTPRVNSTGPTWRRAISSSASTGSAMAGSPRT